MLSVLFDSNPIRTQTATQAVCVRGKTALSRFTRRALKLDLMRDYLPNRCLEGRGIFVAWRPVLMLVVSATIPLVRLHTSYQSGGIGDAEIKRG